MRLSCRDRANARDYPTNGMLHPASSRSILRERESLHRDQGWLLEKSRLVAASMERRRDNRDREGIERADATMTSSVRRETTRERVLMLLRIWQLRCEVVVNVVIVCRVPRGGDIYNDGTTDNPQRSFRGSYWKTEQWRDVTRCG
jgi:hypothetical protein